jgi:hypothetical protein
MQIIGNYGQMSLFVAGLDKFPRLFVIQNFTLSFGAATASASSSGTSSAAAASASPGSSPLWVGGTPTAPTAGPYSLSLIGSIYYTNPPNATAACTAATTAAAK